MSEIPEDVMEAARAVQRSVLVDPNWFLAGTTLKYIAEAILAERKRRAQYQCACGGIPSNPYPGWEDEQ